MNTSITLHARLGTTCVALFVLLSICSAHTSEQPALKYEQPVHLAGSIFASAGKQLFFKFNRTATRSGSLLKVQRDFSYPDGKLAARELVVYKGDALVSFDLDELQTGAKGRATIHHSSDNQGKGSIEFEYTAGIGGRAKVCREELTHNTLVADMVGPFLISHWAELQKGEKLKCRYIVVPRAETVGFTFSKVSDAEANLRGSNVTIVKMEATSPFIAAVIDPLFFTIEQGAPHRVLQYVGRTTPKIQVGGKWRDLDALTVFDWNSTRSDITPSTASAENR